MARTASAGDVDYETWGQDLTDGTWDARYGHLRTQPEFIGSLRLIRAVP
jgi:hypothetical protein